ncbi:MAG: hypothetical protein Q8L47_02660 [bacterium]|nr:hypothetical protein [bacterium]
MKTIFTDPMTDKMTVELNVMKSDNLLQEKTSIFGLSDFRGHQVRGTARSLLPAQAGFLTGFIPLEADRDYKTTIFDFNYYIHYRLFIILI